jgi:hypothetical protein
MGRKGYLVVECGAKRKIGLGGRGCRASFK